MTLSAIAVPSVAMRVASHGGTRPPCSGRSATPERFTGSLSLWIARKYRSPGTAVAPPDRMAQQLAEGDSIEHQLQVMDVYIVDVLAHMEALLRHTHSM